MKLERFASERSAGWSELRELIGRARGKPERLGADGVRRLGHLYRTAAADLATARREFPGDPLVASLEDIVGKARPLVYGETPRRTSVWTFLSRDYWKLVRERPRLLAVAALLLLGPAALAWSWALDDPGAAGGLLPREYRAVTEQRQPGEDLGLAVEEQLAFSSAIFTNNVRVTFLAFAGGALAGLGTVAIVMYNGVFIGAVGGLASGAGNTGPFMELVAAHGVLELSCIVVAAAAGLRLGWALIEPGRGRRRDALAAQARPTVQIVLGTAPWLVLAGFVEGFVTPAGLGLRAAVVVGVTLALVYWSLVLVRGKEPRPPPQTRASDLARR